MLGAYTSKRSRHRLGICVQSSTARRIRSVYTHTASQLSVVVWGGGIFHFDSIESSREVEQDEDNPDEKTQTAGFPPSECDNLATDRAQQPGVPPETMAFPSELLHSTNYGNNRSSPALLEGPLAGAAWPSSAEVSSQQQGVHLPPLDAPAPSSVPERLLRPSDLMPSSSGATGSGGKKKKVDEFSTSQVLLNTSHPRRAGFAETPRLPSGLFDSSEQIDDVVQDHEQQNLQPLSPDVVGPALFEKNSEKKVKEEDEIILKEDEEEVIVKYTRKQYEEMKRKQGAPGAPGSRKISSGGDNSSSSFSSSRSSRKPPNGAQNRREILSQQQRGGDQRIKDEEVVEDEEGAARSEVNGLLDQEQSPAPGRGLSREQQAKNARLSAEDLLKGKLLAAAATSSSQAAAAAAHTSRAERQDEINATSLGAREPSPDNEGIEVDAAAEQVVGQESRQLVHLAAEQAAASSSPVKNATGPRLGNPMRRNPNAEQSSRAALPNARFRKLPYERILPTTSSATTGRGLPTTSAPSAGGGFLAGVVEGASVVQEEQDGTNLVGAQEFLAAQQQQQTDEGHMMQGGFLNVQANNAASSAGAPAASSSMRPPRIGASSSSSSAAFGSKNGVLAADAVEAKNVMTRKRQLQANDIKKKSSKQAALVSQVVKISKEELAIAAGDLVGQQQLPPPKGTSTVVANKGKMVQNQGRKRNQRSNKNKRNLHEQSEEEFSGMDDMMILENKFAPQMGNNFTENGAKQVMQVQGGQSSSLLSDPFNTTDLVLGNSPAPGGATSSRQRVATQPEPNLEDNSNSSALVFDRGDDMYDDDLYAQNRKRQKQGPRAGRNGAAAKKSRYEHNNLQLAADIAFGEAAPSFEVAGGPFGGGLSAGLSANRLVAPNFGSAGSRSNRRSNKRPPMHQNDADQDDEDLHCRPTAKAAAPQQAAPQLHANMMWLRRHDAKSVCKKCLSDDPDPSSKFAHGYPKAAHTWDHGCQKFYDHVHNTNYHGAKPPWSTRALRCDFCKNKATVDLDQAKLERSQLDGRIQAAEQMRHGVGARPAGQQDPPAGPRGGARSGKAAAVQANLHSKKVE